MCEECKCNNVVIDSPSVEDQEIHIANAVADFCEQYDINPKVIIETVRTVAIERLQKRIIAHEMVMSDARAAIQRLDYEIAELNRK
jgi:hypothetical protein